jgi:hypothetical protein
MRFTSQLNLLLSTVGPTGACSLQSAKLQTVTNGLSAKLQYQVGIFHHLLCLATQANRSDSKQFTLAPFHGDDAAFVVPLC